MEKYLVGGYVRDKLLGLKNNDKDYVVVNSSPDEMIKLGFEQVGMSFPVFLHPETREEYALARKELSTGNRTVDFKFETHNVSLKEDMSRRDLTINSMAFDDNGNLIDYFNGKSDLNNKILRHVSSAFAEDPLRILRVARFAARFNNFTIASETLDLMKEMVSKGAINALPIERISLEIYKTLNNQNCWKFFQVLNEVGALEKIKNLNVNDVNINLLKNNTRITGEKVLLLLFIQNSFLEKLTFNNQLLIGSKMFKQQILIFNIFDFLINGNCKSIDKVNNNLGREILQDPDFLLMCDIYNSDFKIYIELLNIKLNSLNKALAKMEKTKIIDYKINYYKNIFIEYFS